MTTFKITVNIASADLDILKKDGYSLYAFKSVETSGSGGVTVWYTLDSNDLLSKNEVSWTDDYEAFNSISNIENNVQIIAGNSLSAQLGNLISISTNGNLSKSTDGFQGSISYINNASKMYTVGYIQNVKESNNITCAFNILGGNASRIIVPVNKVALIFSPASIELGTVINKAMSSGILIDLEGAENNMRDVTFKTSDGWTSNTQTWASNFISFTDLRTLLIQPPKNIELWNTWYKTLVTQKKLSI